MLAFKNILVAADAGEPSKHALEVGVDLAKRFGGALTIVHAWGLPSYAYSGFELGPFDLETPLLAAAREHLDALVAEAKKQIPEVKGLLKNGVAWREILSAIEEVNPDVVVIGTHGRRGLDRVVLGSVAEKVVRMSPVAVLTVHPHPKR
jgi:nucleotide-binding universal stress UspA family protein